MNIIHMKKDGKEDEQAVEKKYRWDKENRLLASDENGFVASYWYDADGQRTVKSSGEGEQIYVNCRASREQSQACLSFAKAQPTIICDNSEFSGGVTNTAKFSLYVSPYLVASQGGKYTKHIYIGSQRIVSKLGDLASYGADPRRIPYAGTEADGVSVDYQTKYNRQQQAIKDNYADFGVPYNGEDNNDYVNGEGFCCNDGTPTVARAKAARSIEGNLTELNLGGTRQSSSKLALPSLAQGFKPNDDYEKMQFYYHPDHLGSSSYITNLDGEVVQHIEYVPFGEVFIEERNNTWNTPYLFNAKEYDEETGMYYYGARYYEPRVSLWMSTDPKEETCPDISSYTYCHNSPINLLDIDGMDDYKINQIGQITFWRRTNAKSTHRIFAGKDNITFGKQFVSQLVEKQSANGTTAKTSNSDDAFEFFKFAADHTKVEWSLIGLQKNNSVEFKLHSDFNTSSVSLDTKDYKDQVFQLHNHPSGSNPNNTKASGDYDAYKQTKPNQAVQSYYAEGDLWTLNNVYNAYKQNHPKAMISEYPKAYIYYSGYNKQQPQLYQYDLGRSRFRVIYKPSYQQIKNRVNK